MNKERFVIADTHFGHDKILTFKNGEDPLRPFDNPEHMHEEMIDRWNSVVRPQDVVYVAGDVALGGNYGLSIFGKLNGSKRLIFGNHDIYGHKKYKEYFKDMYAYRVFVDRFIISHIPLHPDSVTHRFKVNVHGHLHANEVKRDFAERGILPDPRYLCVSVEQPWMNYTPLNLDDIADIAKERFEAVGWPYPMDKSMYEELQTSPH